MGHKVKALRLQLGLTAGALAARFNVPRSSLMALEAHGNASLDTLRAARAFLRNPEPPKLRRVTARPVRPASSTGNGQHQPIDRELGRALLAARHRAHLTCEQLAEQLGVSRASLTNLERYGTGGGPLRERVRGWLYDVPESAMGVE